MFLTLTIQHLGAAKVYVQQNMFTHSLYFSRRACLAFVQCIHDDDLKPGEREENTQGKCKRRKDRKWQDMITRPNQNRND